LSKAYSFGIRLGRTSLGNGTQPKLRKNFKNAASLSRPALFALVYVAGLHTVLGSLSDTVQNVHATVLQGLAL
jgi:hypothetical protein